MSLIRRAATAATLGLAIVAGFAKWADLDPDCAGAAEYVAGMQAATDTFL